MTRDEFIQAWVTALRSGEFHQGKNVLHNQETDTYCCLGVACEVLRQHGDLYARTTTEQELYLGTDGGGNSYTTLTVTAYGDELHLEAALLPHTVSELLGLTESDEYGEPLWIDDPIFRVTLPGDEEPSDHCVSSLNDTYGFTFAQIADLIESQLL